MRTKHLEEGEAKCISICGEKYMKTIQRIGFRMAEYQMQHPEQGMITK